MESKLEWVAAHFADCKVRFSEDQTILEILNPAGNDPIKIEYEGLSREECTVSFSFQHRHLSDNDEIAEFIHDIMTGNVLAIEFFKDGKRRFGGDIPAEALTELSHEALAAYFGMPRLNDMADSFKVRGWNPDANFDAEFVMEPLSKITVKRK